mmetsp:Transcript_2730/g.5611  ORF Transcript_2730/g.5611 Transcript_2730/m.5611 type:complete len:224 (+) Transcript_2730:70-741(+)
MSSILKMRGLSGREGGSKSTLSKGLTNAGEKNVGEVEINMDNVHNATLFELRQSLMKRGHFKADYSGPITYEILLSKMVSLLQADIALLNASRLTDLEEGRKGVVKEDGSVETLAERLKREKEERKREAMERSRKRQEEKGYFEGKKRASEEGRKEKEKRLEDGKIKSMGDDSVPSDVSNSAGVSAGDGDVDVDGSPVVNDSSSNVVDPFKVKFKSKIGGRYS